VYFVQRGQTLVILLAGGDKHTQGKSRQHRNWHRRFREPAVVNNKTINEMFINQLFDVSGHAIGDHLWPRKREPPG